MPYAVVLQWGRSERRKPGAAGLDRFFMGKARVAAHLARSTRDVDLRIQGDPGGLLEALQVCGRLDLGDYLTYELSIDAEHAGIQNDGMVYEGQRFRALCGSSYVYSSALHDHRHGLQRRLSWRMV